MDDLSSLTKRTRHWPKFVWLGTVVVLLLAALPLPYGIYAIVRIITFLSCILIAISTVQNDRSISAWTFIYLFLALLFNPLFTIHLSREEWIVIDIASAVGILVHLSFVRGLRS
jgi:hypothetical protein